MNSWHLCWSRCSFTFVNKLDSTQPTNIDISVDDRVAQRATYISLIVSLFVLGLKFWGYSVTHSQAVFSDAMESIVNVVASALAIAVVAIARKPADREHPYGHGKAEFFSAAFEGGLITFASVLIGVEAVNAIVHGSEIRALGLGLMVTVAGGLINAVLGLYLIRVGRRHHSAALEASGHHVLSDFWTSLGVIIGLGLVALTDLPWLDSACALALGVLLMRTGFKLVRSSISGLMDEEDVEIIENLLSLMNHDRPAGIIQLHYLRVMRSGPYHHIDAHAVVPEFWNVAEAHTHTEDFENQLMQKYPYRGELHLHVDPCRQLYCEICDVEKCPIRQQSFRARKELTLEELVNPMEPSFLRSSHSEKM